MTEGDELPKIVIVTEGGSMIGMGHVYRSITLAQALRSDAILHFLTRSDKAIAEKIERSGFNATRCETDEEILNRLNQASPSVITFDVPQLSARLIEQIRTILGQETSIVVFDNYSAPDVNRHIDVVVNALVRGDFENKFVYDKDANTRYYFGPKYLILRDEFFFPFEQPPRLSHPHEKRLLLFFGGGDYANLTTSTLDHVLNSYKEAHVHIIIGPAFSHLKELEVLIQAHKGDRSRIKVNKDVANVAELMGNVDVVITSPGVSMFEALRLRKPVIAIYQNDYQKAVYKNFPLKCIIEQSEAWRIDILLQEVDNYDPEYVDKLKIGEGKSELLQVIRGLLSPNKTIDLT